MMTRSRTQLLLQLAAAFLLILGVQARTWTLAVADLDGVAGKVFDLKPDGSFRFLKQDVQIDPETGKGQPWFAAYAGKDVEIVQREDRKNLAGLKDPVIAVFTGFDDANAKALKDGESFRADHMVLRPDLKEAAGVSADGQTLAAWFTPRQARFSRDGVIKLGGKEIPGGVKGGGVRIAIAQQRSVDDLKEGSWRVTLSGKLESGRFVVDKMQLNPLPDQVKDDDPKLPRVLSIGDSISMNYEAAARESLKGIANYHRITDNSWSTDRCKSFVSGILICDLAEHIDNSPEFDNWRKGRDVHFWKAGEQALVGKAVAGSVKKALEFRRRRN